MMSPEAASSSAPVDQVQGHLRGLWFIVLAYQAEETLHTVPEALLGPAARLLRHSPRPTAPVPTGPAFRAINGGKTESDGKPFQPALLWSATDPDEG